MPRTPVLALLLSACVPEDPGPRAFVARGDVYVGVVGDASGMRLYACDGAGEVPTVAAWFEGDVTDESFSLSLDDGATAEGAFDGAEGVSGTVTTADGRAFDFDGEPVPVDATDRGLFWAPGSVDEGAFLAGWVAWSADDQRGGLGLSVSGTLFAVPPLGPARTVELQVGAESVSVEVVNAVGPFLE